MEFDELDSTNAALRRVTEEGGEVAEGLMVWARSQTAGRGRAGRRWESPPGNVYVSILVRAPSEQSRSPEVGFVGALAVRDTIVELPRHNAAPPAITCKWPNDILVEGHKVAGLLPELVTDPDGRDWIVLGIGINLIRVDVPGALYPITTLSDHHVDTTPAHVLTVLGRMLATWLVKWRTEGFAPIRDAWSKCGPDADAELMVRLTEGPVTGRFSRIDEDGALVLETSSGRRRIVAGDVLFSGDA